MTVLESASPRPPGAARRGYHPALALTIIAASQLMVVPVATIVNIARKPITPPAPVRRPQVVAGS